MTKPNRSKAVGFFVCQPDSADAVHGRQKQDELKPIMNGPGISLRASLGTLPQAAWILFFGIFLNKFGTFVLPFLSIYMIKRGFTAGEAGLAMSSFGVGHFCAAVIGGHLADYLGRRKTIVCSMFSVAVAMLCLSQAQSLYSIMIWAFLVGLTGEFYRPASSALLADLAPAEHRITAFAAYRLAFNAGWTFGPTVAGFLASQSYDWLFFGDAATSILFGLVAWFALPEDPARQRSDHGPNGFWPTVKKDKAFHQVLMASLIIGLVYVQIISTLGLEITGSHISSIMYGALMSLNGLLVVLLELPMTTLTKRFPARKIMAIGYVLVGVGFGMNLWAKSAPAFALAIFMFTLGEIISMPVSIAYVANLTPEHLRGRYMGAYGLTWAFALSVGPALGTWIFGYSPVILWSSCLGLGLAAAAIILTSPARSTR